MRTALVLLLLLAALPAAAEIPEKPGAALPAQLPPCDYKTDYWTPDHSLSTKLLAGDWQAVERELEELQASAERNRACERRMAWAYDHGFRFGDDLSAPLDRWVAARPDSWAAYTVRGTNWMDRVWRMAGRAPDAARHATQRATADLERAIELHPTAMSAHVGLIKLAKVWRDPRRVEEMCRRAIAIDPLSVYVRHEALGALQPAWGGTLEATERIVAEARTHEKQNPRLSRLYGFPAIWHARELERRGPANRGERLRIVAYYNKALRHLDDNSAWHYQRTMHYRQLEDWEAVAADAAYAVAANPKAERFWGERIYALAHLGRYDEALAAAREALQHVPGSVDLRWYEADVYFDMGRYDEAAARHHAALADARTERQRFRALGGAGGALMKAKRYAEAEPLLAEASEVDPGNIMNWHQLAEARWQLGKRAEAVPAYERFLELSEGEGWAEETRMRAQEKIDLMRSGAAPPARAGGR